MMGATRKAIGLFALCAMLTACGGSDPVRGTSVSPGNRQTPGQSDTPSTDPGAAPKETPPQTPDPTTNGPNTLDPQPIPPASAPSGDGQVAVKALAHTEAINPIGFVNNLPTNIPGVGGLGNFVNTQRVSVYVVVGWKPYPNAAKYRILRNDDGTGTPPTPQGPPTGTGFNVIATVDGHFQGYKDGGGLMTNLKVMNEYRYVVQALDPAGNVMGQGNDSTRAIYPLAIPSLTQPMQPGPGQAPVHAGLAPTFGWTNAQGADGYYVEVFSTMFAGSPIPVPQWRSYRRGADNTACVYGSAPDVYPGTSPAMWTMVLQPGTTCLWTVAAYKTDTGNVQTAKAFAKSSAPPALFTP